MVMLVMGRVQGQVLGFLISGLIFYMSVRSGEAQSIPFRISCGTNSSLDVDGRRWIGDLAPNNNLTMSSPGITASTASVTDDSSLAELYKTARFFTDSLNYTVKASQGNHIIRLIFYPFSFESYNVNESSFDVVANGVKLLAGFNVPGEVVHRNAYLQSSGGNSSSSSLVKEYFLTVNVDVLVVEFIPSEGSFGFVNAIEIV